MSRQQERDRTHQRLGTLTARVRAGHGTSPKPCPARRPHVSQALAVKRWEAEGLRVLTGTHSAPSNSAPPIAEPSRTDAAPAARSSGADPCDPVGGDANGTSDVHARNGVPASAESRGDADRADPGAGLLSGAVDGADSGPGGLADGAKRPRLAEVSDASLGGDIARHIPQVNWALGGLAPAADDEVPSVGDDIEAGGSRRNRREPVVQPGVRRGDSGPEGNGDEEVSAAAVDRGNAGGDVGVVQSRTIRTEPEVLSGVHRGGAGREGSRDRKALAFAADRAAVGDDVEEVRSSKDRTEPAAPSGARSGNVGREGNWDQEVLASAPDCEAAGDDVGVVRSPGWLTEPTARRGWRDRLVPERFRGIRVDPGRRGVCTLLAVGVVAMVVAGVVIFRERPIARPVPPLPAVHSTADAAAPAPPPGTAAQSGTGPKPVEPGSPVGELVVSVVGLVHRTGLVRLPTGARVADALTAAGGPRDGADTTGLNLAQRLSDGDQVLVGPSGADPAAPKLGSATISAGGRPTAPSGSGSAQPQPSSGRLDLNTATEAQLDALPGVGPVTAKAIITWRTTHGRFTDTTQLGEVDGIGTARLARLRELVRV
ncbi:hypothetical protein NBRGN_001_00240 [Nocardia brasiliensis NBRC 14402]|nr:hypothetical protein NBRGN_001_00240 [Nocardia brasiliensis NBRC 14402]